MLINIYDLPKETKQEGAIIIGYSLRGIIAIDPETQAEMHCSHARRKLGRPKHYFIIAPDGGTHIHYFRSAVTPDNPKGASYSTDYSRVFGVSAFTDNEAIEKANKLFAKKYAKFKAEEYCEQVREEGKDFGRAWWQEG